MSSTENTEKPARNNFRKRSENADGNENREKRDNRGNRDNRDNRDSRDRRGNRDNSENRDSRPRRTPRRLNLELEYPAELPEVPARPDIEDIKKLHEKQHAQIDSITKQIEETRAKMDKLGNDGASDELGSIKVSLEGLYAQVDALKEKNRANLDTRDKSRAILNENKEKLGKDFNRTAADVNNEMSELIELIEHHCSGKDGKVQEKVYQSRFNTLRNTVLPGVMAITAAKKDLDTASSELREYNANMETLNKSITELKQRRTDLMGRRSENSTARSNLKARLDELYKSRKALYESVKSSSAAYDEAKERYFKAASELKRLSNIQEDFRAAWAPHLKNLDYYGVTVAEKKRSGVFEVSNWKKTLNSINKAKKTSENDFESDAGSIAERINSGLFIRRNIVDWCKRAIASGSCGATITEKAGSKTRTIIDYEILGWLMSEKIDADRIKDIDGIKGVLDEVSGSMNEKIQAKIDEINRNIRIELKSLRLKKATLKIEGEDESIMAQEIPEPVKKAEVEAEAEVDADAEKAEVEAGEKESNNAVVAEEKKEDVQEEKREVVEESQ